MFIDKLPGNHHDFLTAHMRVCLKRFVLWPGYQCRAFCGEHVKRQHFQTANPTSSELGKFRGVKHMDCRVALLLAMTGLSYWERWRRDFSPVATGKQWD